MHLGLAALQLARQWWLSIYHFGVFKCFISFFFQKTFLPYLYCFDRQEVKMRPLEAHDGGMRQDICIDEQV
jgi:hypothetical protein